MFAYPLVFNPRSKATNIAVLLSLGAVLWLEQAQDSTTFSCHHPQIFLPDLGKETQEIEYLLSLGAFVLLRNSRLIRLAKSESNVV